MKKHMQKMLSLVLVAIMFATSLPITVFATDDDVQNGQTVSTDMGDMSITATNSFGEMITDSLNGQTEEMDSGHYISDVEYDSNSAVITFVTKQDCTIRVAAYEENTGRMITSASVGALAEDTEAVVEFVDELPDYFVLKAFMLDENSAPLCKAYTCNEQTKVYEDFAATTVDDYDEDKVINLDEDETTNFLVMSDETSTITNNSKTNVLVSYDEETGIYIFDNVDEQITSLRKDDIFYFDNGNVEELTFIKVGAVDIDGTTAYITEAEASLEEVFDVVKIDNEMTSGEFALNEDEELEDGVTYLGCEEVEEPDDEISTYAWESDKSITFKHNFELKKEIKPKEPNKISNNVSLTGKISISGTAGVTVKGTFKYYISKEFSEIEFTITPSIGLNISLEGVGRLEVKLKSFDISPCAGVYVGISPKIIMEASVKASFDATLKFTVGFGFNSNDGLVNKTKKPSFKPEFKIEGEMFVGVDLAPNVSVISKKIIKFELGTEIGAKLTAEISTNSDEMHACDSCLDGDIDLVGSLSGKMVFGEGTKWKKSVEIKFLGIKIDIAKFYYSFSLGKFGWGECENYITASGTCGDNLSWTFNGGQKALTISGTGKMDDYSWGASDCPWEEFKDYIKTVIIEEGATNIGGSAFDSCRNLISVKIPSSVVSIDECSFFNCYELEKIIIPNSVKIIGRYAFRSCYNLKNIKISANIVDIGLNAFEYCTSLISFIVDKNNLYYSSDEKGILFNKDKSMLIQYPLGNERTSYTVPNSVITIVESAFSHAYNLENITLSNKLETIEQHAFSWSSINNIIIPDSVIIIEQSAFYCCGRLESINIPKNVLYIESITFDGCSSLTEITVDEENKNLSNDECGVLFDKNKTVLIHYPDANLKTSYVIPNGVVAICERAFNHCYNLATITIPNSVKEFYNDGFNNFYYIKTVHYNGTVEQWENIIGNDSFYNATIHYNASGVTYSSRTNQINMISFAIANTTDLTEYVASASNVISGNEYIIIVLNHTADINDFTNNELLYIDQKTAEADGDITFNYAPKTDDDCIVYIIGIFSDTNSVKQELITPTNTNEPENPDYDFTFYIQEPSRTKIRNMDGIYLYAVIDGNAPEGSYVRWESSNGNFDEDADASNLKIIAKNKGWTTFTAILCDADGNELARDSVEMYSKSGFFDKIGGFFRSLLGATKIYGN